MNMKNFYLLILSVSLLFSLPSMAQSICNPPCTPDVSCQEILSPGQICPEILPTAIANQYYDETVTVIPPATFNLGGTDYDIYQIRLDAVNGLPAGMSWCKSQELFVVEDPYVRYCTQLTGTPTVPGEYQLTLLITPYYSFFGNPVALPQQTDDTSLLIIVLPAVTPPVAAFSANPTTSEINSDVVFTDLSTNTPTEWAWVFEGGTPPTSDVQNPTVYWTVQGSYDVSLTATNAGGNNTISMTDYITITDHTGINDAINGSVKIYPNPASHEITVEAVNMESISIVDVLGKIVYTTEVTSEKTTIDISKLNKANYFIKVKTAEGEITKSISIK